MTDFSRNIACARCETRPCGCEDPGRDDPAYRTLEDERPGFEAFVRQYFPQRSLVRYGHTYKEASTRGMWLGWQAKARVTPRLVARRV